MAENGFWTKFAQFLGAPMHDDDDRSALRQVYDANIGDPLGLNRAAEGFRGGVDAARAAEPPRRRAPLPDFTTGEVVEPNSAFEWQQEQARNTRNRAMAGVSSGFESWWDGAPPELKEGLQNLMRQPIVNATVAGGKHFVEDVEDPAWRAAMEGLGVGGKTLLSEVQSFLAGESPEFRSFTEIEGFPRGAALLSELAVGGLDVAGEAALASRQLAHRIPQAIRETGEVGEHLTRNRLLRQNATRVREGLAEVPAFQALPPDFQEEIIREAATAGGNEHILVGSILNSLARRDPTGFTHPADIAQYEEIVDAVRGLGLDPLPPDPLNPYARLFEGADEEDANEIFNRVANEGEVFAGVLDEFRGRPLEPDTIREWDNKLDLIIQTDDEAMTPLVEAIRGAFQAMLLHPERRWRGADFEDLLRDTLPDEEVDGAMRELFGFGQADSVESLRRVQTESGDHIMRGLGDDIDPSTGLQNVRAVQSETKPDHFGVYVNGELRGFLNKKLIDDIYPDGEFNIVYESGGAPLDAAPRGLDETDDLLEGIGLEPSDRPRTGVDPETGQEYEDFGPISPDEKAAIDERVNGPSFEYDVNEPGFWLDVTEDLRGMADPEDVRDYIDATETSTRGFDYGELWKTLDPAERQRLGRMGLGPDGLADNRANVSYMDPDMNARLEDAWVGLDTGFSSTLNKMARLLTDMDDAEDWNGLDVLDAFMNPSDEGIGGLERLLAQAESDWTPAQRRAWLNQLDGNIDEFRPGVSEGDLLDELNGPAQAPDGPTSEAETLASAGLGEVRDAFSDGLLNRPGIRGSVNPDGIELELDGASVGLSRNSDGSYTTDFLTRGTGERGAGSALKREVLRMADEHGITLRAVNAPSGPGDLIENMRKNAARLESEGYKMLPDGSWERPPGGGK